jgi:D-sedoheptulose 7-phosphate isomerase
MTHSQQFFEQTAKVALSIDHEAVERMANRLAKLREDGGRLFILGVGGSAANSSHAVGDFRKLAEIEAYAPSDNIAELTARTNDDGWDTVFAAWLRTSHAESKDAVLVLSVGGGDAERNISPNIVLGLNEAKRRGLAIYGIVGRRGGHTDKIGDEVIVVPEVDPAYITPHSESFQSIIWHCLVFHPSLMVGKSKWENVPTAPEK